VDLLFEGVFFLELWGERIQTRSDQGTGCTVSAASAALLARRVEVGQAVEEAKRFVEEAMKSACPLGSGHGPLNHFCRFRTIH
jgi:hydroxymethylpyrimidine/phosphomethylpyrimidine kinase